MSGDATDHGSSSILKSITTLERAWTRLNDIERSGQVMVAFMRGHMAEINAYEKTEDYFMRHYGDVAKEFIQYDDYVGVTHHCVAQIYRHIAEEFEQIHAGVASGSFHVCWRQLPRIGRPTTATRRPPVAASWYRDVYKAFRSGEPVQRRGPGNEPMPAEQCVMRTQAHRNKIWSQLIVMSGEAYATELRICWEIFKTVAVLRSALERNVDGGKASMAPEKWAAAIQAIRQAYEAWRGTHALTLEIHDPMLDQHAAGLYRWYNAMMPDKAWRIKEDLKDEMYEELARSVLRLRGYQVPEQADHHRYWRVLAFNPNCIRPGDEDLPM